MFDVQKGFCGYTLLRSVQLGSQFKLLSRALQAPFLRIAPTPRAHDGLIQGLQGEWAWAQGDPEVTYPHKDFLTHGNLEQRDARMPAGPCQKHDATHATPLAEESASHPIHFNPIPLNAIESNSFRCSSLSFHS